MIFLLVSIQSIDNQVVMKILGNLQPVEALQDDSCHWYVIPSSMIGKWMELNDLMASDNQTVFEEAESEFIALFSKYMTGGDLNNVQLYAEIK
jgi:hypothetical protein